MKFCVNCEHCVVEQDKYGPLYHCNGWVDLVTGLTYKVPADSMRNGVGGRCGPEGNLFKRKQTSGERYRTDIPELT